MQPAWLSFNQKHSHSQILLISLRFKRHRFENVFAIDQQKTGVLSGLSILSLQKLKTLDVVRAFKEGFCLKQDQ